MFPELEKIFASSSFTKKEIAEKMGMTYNTFCLKLRNSYSFTLDECFKLKKLLNSDLPLEKLFELKLA
ncbi:MAG: hypothetical protein IKB98_10735 [Clostridia bacterium]|nr:hypothetical protein [Clostridia bacterium]